MKPILNVGKNCWGTYHATSCGLLIDACDYFRAFHRAARSARSYILISGWQFDSKVNLLRGEAVDETTGEVAFLPFLTELCRINPELHIYILAWDFSVIFAMEREWFQEWIFNWSGHERLHFVFDKNHPVSGTHHQKFVVIDGHTAFVGGIDLCSYRWDDRSHAWDNPNRVEGGSGRIYDPYHDLQACVTGPVCKKVSEIFCNRWRTATGADLSLVTSGFPTPIPECEPIATDRVALSRTFSGTLLTLQEPIREIRSLYLDAIEAAEHLIYLENQYFSSQSVHDALAARMEATGRPLLDIVMVLPKKPQARSEEMFLGAPQMRMLRSLQEIAARRGHRLGIYYTATRSPAAEEKMIYIHSKLLAVDDRFLTVGSANTTNRSMGMDSELNLSWEATEPEQEALALSIRQLRVELLMEHVGACGIDITEGLEKPNNLVILLDRLAEREHSNLRRHTLDTVYSNKILTDVAPGLVDPERPIVEENVFEMFANGFMLTGIADFNNWLIKKSKEEAGQVSVVGEEGLTSGDRDGHLLSSVRYAVWVLISAILIAIASILWLPNR